MAREFRVGDRVRAIESADGVTAGNIYIVTRYNPDEDHGRIDFIGDSGDNGWGARHFELVEREYSLDTLIKRANLGLTAIHELIKNHKDSVSTLNPNNDETHPIAYRYAYSENGSYKVVKNED